jgi:hypothetical protein
LPPRQFGSTGVKPPISGNSSFGLFDGIADEDLPKIFPLEYEHYDNHKRFEGEFFAPMPLGESRCNVADWIKGVFGMILRDASVARSPRGGECRGQTHSARCLSQTSSACSL